MSAVAAISGLVAMVLVRFVIPTRDPDTATPVLWEIISRVGTFAVNLSAIASIVAIGFGLWPWLRGSGGVNARRRLLIASFTGMLLPIWIRAVFFSRDSMNGALASLGAAAACSLSTLLVVSSIREVRARPMQMLPVVLVTIATLCSLTLLTLQSVALVAPFSPVHRIAGVVADVGEIAYLGVMLCALSLIPRRPLGLRNTAAAGVGALISLVVAAAYVLALVAFSREFAIALYYAQHVTWFLDGAIWIYALPLALGIGSSVAALLSNDAHARQLGIAVLAWIAAGNVARAPWRVALLTLSACLIARAITARVAEANTGATATPEATPPAAPSPSA